MDNENACFDFDEANVYRHTQTFIVVPDIELILLDVIRTLVFCGIKRKWKEVWFIFGAVVYKIWVGLPVY